MTNAGLLSKETQVIRTDVPAEMVWVDLETTGLSVEDKILELGIIITDRWGREQSTFRSLVVSAGAREAIDRMVPFVREMHEKSGLIDEIEEMIAQFGELVTPAAIQNVERDALEWVTEMGVPCKQLPLTGSSVHFDHGFIDRQMPIFSGWFTHRNVDVSTVRELCKIHNNRVYQARLKQVEGMEAKHRVLDDIRASIEEYQFYVQEFLFTA